MSKAFDQMVRARLLHSMHAMGFSLDLQKVIRNYLIGRVLVPEYSGERADPFFSLPMEARKVPSYYPFSTPST